MWHYKLAWIQTLTDGEKGLQPTAGLSLIF